MDLTDKSDAEIMAVVDPIMDNLMDASTAIDYERHVWDFTDRLKSRLSKEQLEWICQDYQSTKGFFSDRECGRVPSARLCRSRLEATLHQTAGRLRR